MSREFAFITKVKAFPDPFLVEISRRTGTTRRQVGFYRRHVTYCPSIFSPILQSIFDDKIIFCCYRTLLKKTVLSYIHEVHETGGGECPSSFKGAVLSAINAIIEFEIFVRMSLPRTRRTTRFINKIINEVHRLRLNRLREEHHLPSSFSSDVHRTKLELNYVLAGKFLASYRRSKSKYKC
jgi:hypothetical protein